MVQTIMEIHQKIMAQVKAPDIPRPEKKEYRTTEDYISGFTRHYSNELTNPQHRQPFYQEWLTPDHARSVAQIAKENIIKKATQWLAIHAPEYSEYDPIEDEYNFRFTDMFTDFKKAMEEVEV